VCVCVWNNHIDIFTCVNHIMIILYRKRDLFLSIIYVSMWSYELCLISYSNTVRIYNLRGEIVTLCGPVGQITAKTAEKRGNAIKNNFNNISIIYLLSENRCYTLGVAYIYIFPLFLER